MNISEASPDIDELIELINLKDEDIDTTDIPQIGDFSGFHLIHEETLRQVPRDFLRAMLEERLETMGLVEELAQKAVKIS
ncbi:MAG: hypothetical protein LBT14_04115 [Treponema sp.]|jgi:hypothetical protein|nr:hypothetical protein [Treponema sp.]